MVAASQLAGEAADITTADNEIAQLAAARLFSRQLSPLYAIESEQLSEHVEIRHRGTWRRKAA